MAVGVVYDPPSPEFPHIAVFMLEGKVVIAEPCASVAEGEKMLEHVARNLDDYVKAERAKGA